MTPNRSASLLDKTSGNLLRNVVAAISIVVILRLVVYTNLIVSDG